MSIQFWFEFGSTYSYPAAMRIEALAASRGIRVDWRVFLLGPIFREQGWNDSPFNLNPAKGRYMWRDLERGCQAQGLPFKRPSVFPRSGLLASRIACRYCNEPWLPEFVRLMYRMNFEHDADISASATVEHCLKLIGQDPDVIIAAAQLAESKDNLRAQTEAAVRLGIFGAPSVLVDNELFWGNDRLEEALSWCIRHPARSSAATHL